MASSAFGIASFPLPRSFPIPKPMRKQMYFIAVSSMPKLWRKGPKTVG